MNFDTLAPLKSISAWVSCFFKSRTGHFKYELLIGGIQYALASNSVPWGEDVPFEMVKHSLPRPIGLQIVKLVASTQAGDSLILPVQVVQFTTAIRSRP